jgi:hypothetical protein
MLGGILAVVPSHAGGDEQSMQVRFWLLQAFQKAIVKIG